MYVGLVHAISDVVGQTSSHWCGEEAWREGANQVSHSSSDPGLELLHYATECIYTVSWHMRKPAPNFEQEWLKRVANNLVSRQKIRGIIKFISEDRYLFRPP
ncbi:hypothetical protein AVEN_135134-1 [Araneus ventricosus]|uniref:Uncharacterized protein n=1 Tax=Araneus ventricosus TaxID=182803 RepID=A0A4Y2PX80_ARAVE|nr:hypothetical protein AVEN_135134-1 [Araneus ventricosus]